MLLTWHQKGAPILYPELLILSLTSRATTRIALTRNFSLTFISCLRKESIPEK